MKKIYELVRRQKVVVWAGAGISLYAGYPTGKQLKEAIFNSLDKGAQETVKEIGSLAELSDEIIKLHDGDRSYLLDIVEKYFQAIPPVSSPGIHHLIAAIPHIHTIITTNYDELFEWAFEGNLDVVVNDAELTNVTSNRTRLFKVHGDFRHREEIILSGDDYVEFFQRQSESLIWAAMMQYMATHHILFVGYNLNDPNVKYTFDKVSRKLQGETNQAFFIAPGLPTHHIKYLQRKNITYIDKTAEQFFPALIRSMNKNIVKDFDRGLIDAEILRKYMANYKKLPILQSKPGKYELKRITEEDGTTKEIFKFKMESTREFFTKFNDYLAGQSTEEFVIPSDKFIKSVLKSGPIIIYEGGRADGTLTLMKVPIYDGTFEITFEDGFEADKIPVKVYGGTTIATIKSNFKDAEMELQVDISTSPPRLTFKFKPPAKFKKIKDAIELYELVTRLAKGDTFTIPVGDKILKNALPHSADFQSSSKLIFEIFKKLKVIEVFYQLKFKDTPLAGLFDDSVNLIEELYEHAVTGKQIIKLNLQVKSSIIKLDDETRETIERIQEGTPFRIKSRNPEHVHVLGNNIDRGVRIVTITDPLVFNYEDVMKNRTLELIIQSKSNTAVVSYERSH